jgi:hypothetical protein
MIICYPWLKRINILLSSHEFENVQLGVVGQAIHTKSEKEPNPMRVEGNPPVSSHHITTSVRGVPSSNNIFAYVYRTDEDLIRFNDGASGVVSPSNRYLFILFYMDMQKRSNIL